MNENEFQLWVKEKKTDSGVDFDLELIKKGANQSNLTPPTIYINKNMLKKPDEIKGIFLHELGHMVHPIEETFKIRFAVAKLLEFGQILIFPYLFKISYFFHLNIGTNYTIVSILFLYLLKFLLNNYFQKISERFKKSEYLADAFSYLNDPEHQQLYFYKKNYLKLSLFDIFVKFSPVFIFETHPTVKERIRALKNKTYFKESLTIK